MIPNKFKVFASESEMQCAFFAHLKLALPKIHPYAFSIPNGGYRNKREAARLKREGLKSGVPDVFIAYPSGTYHGLFIEFKRMKSSKVSDSQKEYLKLLSDNGYFCCICTCSIEAINITKSYITNS